MPLEHIELARLNVPDNPQTRARLAELTHPAGVALQPAGTYEYMTELSKMVTEFLGALVAAAIEGATVVGIVFSVKDLAGAIGTLVTQSLDNLVGIAKRFVEALSKVRDLLSMMTDSNLPNQGWPQAVKG